MHPDTLPPHFEASLQAVRDFLATLFGGDLDLATQLGEATDGLATDRLLVAGSSEAGEALFAVVLDEGWAPVLSQAVLDETRTADEAADLLLDVAAQTYGALRLQAKADGLALPDVVFTVGDLPALAEPVSALTFEWARGDEPLAGGLLFPTEALRVPPPRVEPEASSGPAGSGLVGGPEIIEVSPSSFADFGAEHFVSGDGGSGNLEALSDVELEVTVELGRRRLPLADVLRLTTGSIVELEKLVGQPLEIYANGRLIAEGEAVVIDEQFGVRVTGLAARSRQPKALL